MKNNYKKDHQLEMPFGTASNQLRKNVLFNLLEKLGENYCYRCASKIEKVEELSIDHKIDWLDSSNPKELFFDLDNIGFSHLVCNIDASKRKKRGVKHPSHRAYNEGCRCNECRQIEAERKRRQRNKDA